MILKGYYDGFEFTKYCVINNVKPLLSGSRNNDFYVNPNVNGAEFRRTVLGQIKLEVEITIARNVMENLDHLNKLFNVSEPKRLTFSDRPDRYLMAIVDGNVKFSSSNKLGKAKITFISPDSYWRAREGYLETPFTGDGVIVNNNGTSESYPIFDVNFTSDCGFLNIIGPDGFLALGNPTEVDKIDLPEQEMALNDTITTPTVLETWTRLTNAETYIPDYIKMSSAGSGTANISGLSVNPTTLGTGDQWHGHAYLKSFSAGTYEQTADNFELSSKVDISNMNGTKNTCAMLIVVMDEENNPIMTTSVYDVTSGKNELVVTFKVPDPKDPKRSIIINSDKLNLLNGYIKMSKKGNKFNWEVYSDKTTYIKDTQLRVGQTAHISPSCTHAETGHPIKKGYHDLTYVIGAIKTGQDGTTAYRMDHGRWPIYWIYERDIVEKTKTVVSLAPKTVSLSIENNQMAQLKASKVFIWQAKWGATPVYDQFNIKDVKVKRTYDVPFKEIKNVFTTGDHLHINNETNEVLLNGANASGLLDVDSRFFGIAGGPTQLQILYSDWATLPEVVVTHESRWLS